MKFILKLQKEIQSSVHGLSKIQLGDTITQQEHIQTEMRLKSINHLCLVSVSAQRVETESVMSWLGLAVDTDDNHLAWHSS